MKINLLIIFFFVSHCILSQTKIHQGDGTFLSNKVLLSIKDNQFIKGDKSGNFSSDEILFTIDRDEVKQGKGQSLSNKTIYTFDDNKIRLGDGKFPSNKVIYTITDNKILKGDEFGRTYFAKTVQYTIDGNKIRKGDGTFLSNTILYIIEGEITSQQLLLTLVLLEN